MNPPANTVVLVTGNHLCHNPRVLKEADTLHAAGFSVSVLGAWLDTTLAERDRELLTQRQWTFNPVIDLTNAAAARQRQRLRVRAKLGRLLGQWLRYENRWQLGYTAPELLRAARSCRADLFIAHSEPALWVLSQLRPPSSGSPLPAPCSPLLGVDMEDWFSDDLLPEARRSRPVALLRRIERDLLRASAHSACPSAAMSRALAAEYGCRPPLAIYNAFAWSERAQLDGLRKDRQRGDGCSLHWYSQTLGPGRGLEELFQALPLVKGELEIHLRGQLAAGAQAWLDALVPPAWKARVFTHPLVSNVELLSRIAEHDIGFAGELKYCRSRDLTITNKILQYLLGGLAVVASDTAGQREVAELAPGAVGFYSTGDSASLAARINALLESPERLRAAKAAALRAAEKTFCWERNAPRLVESVRHALASA